MRIDHYFYPDAEVISRLDRIEKALKAFVRYETRSDEMASAATERLIQVVANNSTVSNSVVALIEGLAEQVRNLKPDEDAINALADEIEASAKRESDAVAANTEVPNPPPAPPAEPIVE